MDPKTLVRHSENLIATRSLILLVFGGVLLLLAIRRLHQFRLRERYAVLFLMIGLPFLLLAWWPLGIQWISDQLRIDSRTFMLLAITGFLLLAVFELLTIVSVQDRKITTLAQEVAILMEQRTVQPGSAADPIRLES